MRTECRSELCRWREENAWLRWHSLKEQYTKLAARELEYVTTIAKLRAERPGE